MTTKSKSLIRIEHKLDLIIRALQESNLMIKDLPSLKGIQEDLCPVCNTNIKIIIDLNNEEPVRQCACTLPVAAVSGISTLLQNPTNNTKSKEKSNASTSERNVSDEGAGAISPNGETQSTSGS